MSVLLKKRIDVLVSEKRKLQRQLVPLEQKVKEISDKVETIDRNKVLELIKSIEWNVTDYGVYYSVHNINKNNFSYKKLKNLLRANYNSLTVNNDLYITLSYHDYKRPGRGLEYFRLSQKPSKRLGLKVHKYENN